MWTSLLMYFGLTFKILHYWDCFSKLFFFPDRSIFVFFGWLFHFVLQSWYEFSTLPKSSLFSFLYHLQIKLDYVQLNWIKLYGTVLSTHFLTEMTTESHDHHTFFLHHHPFYWTVSLVTEPGIQLSSGWNIRVTTGILVTCLHANKTGYNPTDDPVCTRFRVIPDTFL